jgi:hypothetical protein
MAEGLTSVRCILRRASLKSTTCPTILPRRFETPLRPAGKEELEMDLPPPNQ